MSDPYERTFEAHWKALVNRQPGTKWTQVEKHLAEHFYALGRLDQAMVIYKEVQSPNQTEV